MNKLYYIWLRLGVRMKWISPPYCMTHDNNTKYMTEEEVEEWDSGGDPCHIAISVIRFKS
jgi:TPP-dependent pyruvate/acetoin dehydrogenase alpha subunit